MSSEYVSNATLEQIGARILAATRILVTTHSKPDGDAMGSCLALARALCAAGADLNADGLRDYVLVLEKEDEDTTALSLSDAQRPLLVVVRRPGGTLHVAARNDRVVHCAACGGSFGDPFEGVSRRTPALRHLRCLIRI